MIELEDFAVQRAGAPPDSAARWSGWLATRHFADLSFEAAVCENPDSQVHMVSRVKSEWQRDR
jgi:hypothetical protein